MLKTILCSNNENEATVAQSLEKLKTQQEKFEPITKEEKVKAIAVVKPKKSVSPIKVHHNRCIATMQDEDAFNIFLDVTNLSIRNEVPIAAWLNQTSNFLPKKEKCQTDELRLIITIESELQLFCK